MEKNSEPARAIATRASPAELNACVRARRVKGSTPPEPRCSGRQPLDGAADRDTDFRRPSTRANARSEDHQHGPNVLKSERIHADNAGMSDLSKLLDDVYRSG